MGKILANGIDTHYQRMAAKGVDPSTAPTVVFIHGLGTDSLASFYLTLAAPVAAAGINVLAYDLRGHGRSDCPDTGYTFQHFVSDLCALLDALEIQGPVHLVGNSFGGTVAFGHAFARPWQVASIVSIESEPPTQPWSDRMVQAMDYMAEQLSSEQTFLDLEAQNGAHHAKLARKAAAKLYATTMVTDLPKGRLMSAEELRALPTPVLHILGGDGLQGEDPRALERALSHCRTVVIPGQDHSVLVDAHRTVRELLIPWVRGIHTDVPWINAAAEARALIA
ncbi:alpha/beta fold hydrolase [Kutzneria kofuensis]|uniref:Pimeloyl-ACP methyl ester carboxylesterase n=1 Tax=Kutzneria kofuensis TaxID=103725 RepID=A0A7W9NI74_9PSEU|nr:alpha/beta hydrolase [Kutzneria kofuensis]MBB5893001.1 pimeloyl-ACP methyl ester carboxylesterase [Kutzneria kofuensis]